MPPLRPLVRHFSRPSGASTSRYLVSLITEPGATSSIPSAAATVTKSFSTSSVCKAGDSHYEAPSGWLFGVPPGEKYKKEGWENIWVWGFWGSIGVAVVAYAYKPDTSIQTWALEEARRRLEAEGILPDPQTAGLPVKSN